MREVLTRRFKRLMAEAPRGVVKAEAEPQAPLPSLAGDGGLLGFAEATPHPAVFGGDPLAPPGHLHPSPTGYGEGGAELAVPPRSPEGEDDADHAENEDVAESPWPD